MQVKPRSSRKASLYSVHPGVASVQDWIAALPQKTGRSLDEWIRLLKKSGPPSERERLAWLKKEHGLGTNAAGWLARRAEGKGLEDSDPSSYLEAASRYVEEMYAGPKSTLRPIHDAIVELCLTLGQDVRICPCKTIVPLYRKHVFAQIKPSTRTRIDLGFALANRKATGKLIDTGGYAKKDRITHRIPIASLADIDAEVKRWLKTAYDLVQ